MVTITVLAILLVLAIPRMATARKAANETSAVSSLRTLSSCQTMFRTRFGTYGTVSNLQTNGFVDENFLDGVKSGYRFVTNAAPTRDSWSITAEPINPGVTGDRYFYTDESGVIRFRDGAAATAADSALD